MIRGVSPGLVLAVALGVSVALSGWAPGCWAESAEPERVKVQHILISFKGRTSRFVDRSKKQAETLARELYERARAGEDFAQLVREHSNDRFPGIYAMANKKAVPKPGETRRFDMAKSFGDVSFGLAVGEIGLAEFHPTKSPYGWHIIRRLE